jgi:PAS domain S-box-containing protein
MPNLDPNLEKEIELRVEQRTRRLRAEHLALLEQSRHLEAVFEHAIAPLALFDVQFNVIRANEAYARSNGKKTADIPVQNHFDVFPNDESRRLFEQVVRTRQPYIEQARPFTRHDVPEAEVTYWNVALVPVLGNGGDVSFLFLSLEDVTAQKRAELDLHRQNEMLEELVRQRTSELEAASNAKDQFLAALSHELRTPLTPVLAAATALRDDPSLPDEMREDMAMIARNIGLEKRLINDLLDLTRITRGKMEVLRQPVDVAQVLRRTVDIVSGDLDARGLILQMETPGTPYPTHADAARLHQVFWNLLRNAIKFSPPGGRITVNCQVVDTVDPVHPRLRVSVTDTGLGIEPDVMPRLFVPFEQGDAAISRQFGGLGLGLAITRAILDLHDGTISAQSEGRGKGATFIVELPLDLSMHVKIEEASPPADSKARANHFPLRILLVEDHADTMKLVTRLLQADGHRVTPVTSATAAMEVLESHQFDVLLSDLGLPDGTGYDIMRRAKDQGRTIRGIAMSGYGSIADVNRSMEAGFIEHLTKPISYEALQHSLIRLSNRV